MTVYSLESRGVTIRFGGLVAVNRVDLAVPPAAIVGLVGPNGAGKSTLFGVLSGLLRPTEGRVFLEGVDVTEQRPQVRADLGLARTFQHPEIFSGLTVRQHLTLAHRIRHVKRRVWSDLLTVGSLKPVDAGEAEAVESLIELLGLARIADRPALGLPLGSARLVELARALATAPTVLLLDEPSSGLDSSETEHFENVLSLVAKDRGISVLLVEHDVELVMRVCETINVLDFGTLICCNTPDKVRADPAVRAAYLGEEITEGKGRKVASPAEEMEATESRAISIDGTEATSRSQPGRAAALWVEQMSVCYGDAKALSDVSFSVSPGQAMAVLGPNGAGKSSLARAISGLIRPSSGRIELSGTEIHTWTAHRIRRAGLVHLPEGRGIFRSLTVTENLRMAASSVSDRSARREVVDKALTLFPILGSRRRQLAGSLSGGEQQMLSLARALATNPSLIIADEMSLGLAPRLVDLVFEGLEAARNSGVSVIMIEQYVHRALDFADTCLVLQRGRVVWSGRAGDAGPEVLRHYIGGAMAST